MVGTSRGYLRNECRGGRARTPSRLFNRTQSARICASQPALIGSLTVADAMSGDVVTLHEDERVDTALSRMSERGIRQLPVVDSTGTLVVIPTLDVSSHTPTGGTARWWAGRSRAAARAPSRV
jgi:CBS-domain-containing membrane protein